MLLKEEFASNMSYLEPSINSMIVAGEGKCIVQMSSRRLSMRSFQHVFHCDIFSHLVVTDLMTNKALQEVLYMVICAGNFLNSVSVAYRYQVLVTYKREL